MRAGESGLAAGEIADQARLSVPASTLSHHLKTLIIVGLISQERDATTLICRANYPGDAGAGRFPVVGMLHGSRLRPGAEANGRRCVAGLSVISIYPEGLTHMSQPAKSVAIIGAGPTGLAAAAHALERGLQPIVLEAGDSAGHAVRQWFACAHVLALGL